MKNKDLISREVLLLDIQKELAATGKIDYKKLVNSQPVAFDVDKVIASIREDCEILKIDNLSANIIVENILQELALKKQEFYITLHIKSNNSAPARTIGKQISEILGTNGYPVETVVGITEVTHTDNALPQAKKVI